MRQESSVHSAALSGSRPDNRAIGMTRGPARRSERCLEISLKPTDPEPTLRLAKS